MQKVSDEWYLGFNYLATGFSALVVSTFALKEILTGQLAIDNFGITSLSAMVASLHLFIGLAVYGLLARKYSHWAAAATSLGVFLIEILTIISLSDNFDSPFIVIWLIGVLVAGAFGLAGLVV